jgi:hypothetical protein
VCIKGRLFSSDCSTAIEEVYKNYTKIVLVTTNHQSQGLYFALGTYSPSFGGGGEYLLTLAEKGIYFEDPELFEELLPAVEAVAVVAVTGTTEAGMGAVVLVAPSTPPLRCKLGSNEYWNDDAGWRLRFRGGLGLLSNESPRRSRLWECQIGAGNEQVDLIPNLGCPGVFACAWSQLRPRWETANI